MLADKMTVIYEEKPKVKNEKRDVKEKDKQDKKSENSQLDGQENSIKRIDAEGHVRVFGQDLVATGKFGYYDPKEEIFILEENVVVNRGTSVAEGEKFIYNLKTKKGQFVGESSEKSAKSDSDKSDKRVTVVIGDDATKDGNEKVGKKPK